jgi:hypothetical protein
MSGAFVITIQLVLIAFMIIALIINNDDRGGHA